MAYDATGTVGTEVNINDTHLLCEISPRMALPERNTVVNKSTQRYVQLVISTYLPSEYYNGETICEAGLFSKASGNNCMFRIVFDGITKTEDSVIEVDWTISVISVESENAPYEEIDKTDLRETMEQLLDKIETIDTNVLGASITDLKAALPILMSTSASQTEIDNMTAALGEDYANLDISQIETGGVLTQEEYDKAVVATEEILGTDESE